MIGFIYKIYVKIRQKFFSYPIRKKAVSVGKNLKVNHKCIINNKTFLGNNVNFNGMKIYGNGKVTIGDNFHSGPGCKMITSNHNYDSGTEIPYGTDYIDKDIIINDNVWLGCDVIILGGVTIGEGAIIQAGSVVVKDIPECAIAGGNPANVFKYRDTNHYYELKKAGRYH